jgi:dihydroorotate dehydrogenase electron transfer subunit
MAVVGESTKILSQKQIGDELDILGPIGKGFDTEKEGNALLIGGGIGIFPLLFLSKQLLKRGDYVQAILGFRNKDLAVMYEQFPNVSLVTDDGSLGTKGIVTDIAKDIIKSQQIDKIYTCGPKPMLKAVAKLAQEEDIWCQVSVEEKMACGIGICRACVCKTAAGSQTTVCKNGPVFNAKELAWD